MAPSQVGYTPNLKGFIDSLKEKPVESSIEHLISLLKRRQITNSRPCAVATAELLRQVVAKFKWTDVGKLILRIQQVGQRLIEAQPREMVVGNIVRRVLGMIREEAKENRHDESDSGASSQHISPSRKVKEPISDLPGHSSNATALSPLRQNSVSITDTPAIEADDVTASLAAKDHTSRPQYLAPHPSYAVLNGVPVQQSMFNLLSATPSPLGTPPGAQSPIMNAASLSRRIITSTLDLKAEIIEGIDEIIDELRQADEQIAAYAIQHIHSNEVILTHTSSRTVQSFLLKAAEKRKFTVIVAESYPNDHEATYATVMGSMTADDGDVDEISLEAFERPLTSAGVTVMIITDAAVFALMARVNKVILATHAVIANGGLVAAAGSRMIAKAARRHKTPVIVLSGVYKLSPEYPFEFESLIEYGDPGRVISYKDGDLVSKVEVDNPLFDYVPPELVDLYITNLGAHAPTYLYRIVADHYKPEDINFHNPELQF